MVQIRYTLYFLGIGLLSWLLTRMESTAPGSLRLYTDANPGDVFGTSEYSPVEFIHVAILVACGLLYTWVARLCPSQRAVAIPFGGLAAIFTIRELDYFLDKFVTDNFWQVLCTAIGAILIAYLWRSRRRFRIAWLRIWPSPGLTLLFAGATILFMFGAVIGDESFWRSLLGEHYQPVTTYAVEELTELVGYYFWLIGTIEYTYQARAIAMREPLSPEARRRRYRRRRYVAGRY